MAFVAASTSKTATARDLARGCQTRTPTRGSAPILTSGLFPR
jgi:hypothetical protein